VPFVVQALRQPLRGLYWNGEHEQNAHHEQAEQIRRAFDDDFGCGHFVPPISSGDSLTAHVAQSADKRSNRRLMKIRIGRVESANDCFQLRDKV
jgi:hypothetical protein